MVFFLYSFLGTLSEPGLATATRRGQKGGGLVGRKEARGWLGSPQSGSWQRRPPENGDLSSIV